MLQSIREKTSGWIASIILGLIILTMAFFGVESYLTPNIETYAAKIEGPAKFWVFGKQHHEVSQDEFRKRFEQARQQQRQTLGENFKATEFEKTENKRLILDQLIDETLLTLVSERDGLVLPKSVIQKEIMRVEAFQVNGKFDKNQYQLVLQSQNMTSQQFEQLVRADLMQKFLPSELASSAFTSDAELDVFLRLSQQTRDIRFLDIPQPSMAEQQPSDADIHAWYKAHAAQYRSEEKAAIEYVELNATNLSVTVVADEATLRARYEAEKNRFGVAEQRMASHILVNLDEKASASAVADALNKAKGLAAKARAPGADFAQLARQYSDDVGSKDVGGDLGPVQNGIFGEAFDTAFFALQPGQVSDPVRLPDGWHVILYRQLQAGNVKPFEAVRAELEAEYLESERERVFNDLSGKLVDKIYADPSTLASAAKELKLPIVRTGLFTRNQGEGITAFEPVRKAAFLDTQKLERQVSDLIEVEPNHVIALHVIDYQPAAAIALAQIRDRVQNDVLADRIARAAKAQAEALLARANKGESLDALAVELSREVTSLPQLTRNASIPQLAPLAVEAFRLSRPVTGKSDVGLTKFSPDRYVLVTVTAVNDGDPNAVDAATRAGLREQLAQARGALDARAFIRGLRKQYTIVVAEDRL